MMECMWGWWGRKGPKQRAFKSYLNKKSWQAKLLKQESDVFVWHLHKDGIFSINYMYKFLVSNGINILWIIWCLKIPLKIKIFMLFFQKKRVILTISQKVILSKRNWNTDTTHNLLFWATNHLMYFIWVHLC